MTADTARVRSLKTIEATVKYAEIVEAIKSATLTLGKYHIVVEYSSADERDVYVEYFKSAGFKSMIHWGNITTFAATIEWYPSRKQ
jgi:hypothetical protein